MAARHGPGTIPSDRRDAAKELIRRGTPYTEVQRITGVSAGTCSNIRRELEREGALALSSMSPARAAPQAAPAPPAAPVAAVASPVSDAAEPPPAPPSQPPPALSGDGGLGEDFVALEQQERDVQALLAAARARADYGAMERLTKMRIDLRRGMAQLRPPPPVDPETDVANGEAARQLIARIRRMVAVKQERGRA